MSRWNRFAPNIHQEKTAGAIGVLGFAWTEARLTDQRCLLVAENPGDCHIRNGTVGSCSEDFTAGSNLRQDEAGNLKCLKQFVIPVKRRQIHELGTACIGHVRRMNAVIRTARELPKQVRIDRAKQQIPVVRSLTRIAHIFKHPANLQCAEISAERQASSRAKTVLSTLTRQGRDVVCDTRVLPDDGVVNRLTGSAIPQYSCFTLVGNSDSGKV